jgi:hypothetical protein
VPPALALLPLQAAHAGPALVRPAPATRVAIPSPARSFLRCSFSISHPFLRRDFYIFCNAETVQSIDNSNAFRKNDRYSLSISREKSKLNLIVAYSGWE